jgi:pyruvate dehydrogenase E1 component beta subunit
MTDQHPDRATPRRAAATAPSPDAVGPGATVTMTLREAHKQGPSATRSTATRVVFLLGEDIGAYGGCFAVTMGLLDEYGPERIRDTPLSEVAIVGAAIGAAMNGMRPIAEIMTCNFSLLALDQIVNNAATLLHMSGGQFNVPVVIRTTAGAGRQLAAQHSHSFEPYFAHVPGHPCAVARHARGRPRGAVAGARGPRPGDPVRVPAHHDPGGRAPGDPGPGRPHHRGDPPQRRRRHPRDLRRDPVHRARGGRGARRRRHRRRGDRPAVAAAARRRHRAGLGREDPPGGGVEEAWRTLGIGAEVAARITEEGFYDLDAPVARIGCAEVPLPYAKHLEDAAIPQVPPIVDAVHRVMHRG